MEHKAGPFVAAPTSTGFASLEKVQPDFPNVEQHIQALVAEFAQNNPKADPAGRDALLARQLLDPQEAVTQITCLATGGDASLAHTPNKILPCHEPGM